MAYRAGMDKQPPLPKRIVWFAPWMWKRWKLWTIAVVLVAYPIGIVPVFVVAVEMNLKGLLPDFVLNILEIAYWPLEATASQSIWTFVLLAAYVDFWQSVL